MASDPPYFTNPNFKYTRLLDIPLPPGWTQGRWDSTEGKVELIDGSNNAYNCTINWAYDVPTHGPMRYKNQVFTGATCTTSTDVDGPQVQLGWDFSRCALTVGDSKGDPTMNCPWPSAAGAGVEPIQNGPVRGFSMPEGWTDAGVSNNSRLWGITVTDDQEQLRRCYPSLLVSEPDNDTNALVPGSELTCCTIDNRDEYYERSTCKNPVKLQFIRAQNYYRTNGAGAS